MSTHRKIQLIDDTFEYGLDTKHFLGNVWDTLFDLWDFNIGTFIKKLPRTVKKTETLEDIAFELVFTSLHKATAKLLKEFCTEAIDEAKNLVISKKGFRADTRKDIAKFKIEIDERFMEYPASWPYLKIFKPALIIFLNEELNIEIPKAQFISLKVPEEFWTQLIREYESNKNKYEAVGQFFNSNLSFPFIENFDSYHKRNKLYQNIHGHYHEKVMNHSQMTLADIYIEPNFKIYHRHLPKGNYSQDGDGFVSLPCKGQHAHEYLNNYHLNGETGFDDIEITAEKSRLVLLLGQPGQGKTSFCYRTIYNLDYYIEDDKELILYKLNRLEGKARQFLKTPFDILKEIFDGYNFTFQKGLLILDGLDELYMTEGLSKAEITNFFRTLRFELNKRPELTVLVTSRFHYVDLSQLGKDDLLILSLNPLTLKQQITWLKKYLPYHPDCKLKQDDLVEIHTQKDGKLKGLWELVNQPILLQLVAKAEFEVKKLENRGIIYEKLFDTLIKRSWTDGQLKKYDIDKELFREFLRELAHYIYQSDREFIKVEDLLKLEKTHEFIEESLVTKHEDIGEALKDVLITFYFKRVDEKQLEGKTDAIEFYHKSLQEYLAMEHIWHMVLEKLTKKEEQKKDRKPKYIIKEWKKALELYWSLSTPKNLTEETSQYLRDIIGNNTNEDGKKELEERMSLFFPDLLDYQFQYKFELSDAYINPIHHSLSCFYVIWTILSHLPNGKEVINDENKTDFCNLLVAHQRVNINFFKLENINLNRANLKGINLMGANLGGINLEEGNLNGANLEGINLEEGNLRNANLEGTNLVRAKLQRTNAARINLNGTNLEGADLEGVDLVRANLVRANLMKTNFIGAYLGGANLKGTNLNGSNFERADLEGANLEGANLERANLTKANLTKANLTRANLTKANLTRANLKGANLTRANLKEVDFQRTYFQGANLEGANLQRTYFQGANLEGSNLEGAYFQGSNLEGSNLEGANLEGVYFQGAILERTNLKRANLKKAYLRGVSLKEANLRGVSLKEANLQGANLERANLGGAYFQGANLGGANLIGVNLEGAYLIDIKLNDKNWFDYLSNLKVIGYQKIIKKYEIIPIYYEDETEIAHYTLKLKDK